MHFTNTNTFHDTVLFSYVDIEMDEMAELGLGERKRHVYLYTDGSTPARHV